MKLAALRSSPDSCPGARHDALIASSLDSCLTELCRFFADTVWRGESYVLATIVRTEGSTYRKAGARILIASSGISSGILSAGCLETDLHERAARVLATGRPELASFGSRTEDDALWGTGLGCEGATHVWLQPVTAAKGYEPLPYLRRCLRDQRAGMLATVIGGEALPGELGRYGCAGAADPNPLARLLATCRPLKAEIVELRYLDRVLEVFASPVTRPPALLLCGAGPDALPLSRLTDILGWQLTVYDHRPAYVQAGKFPESATAILGRPEELTQRLRPEQFDATVIMSHHLNSDIEYLRQLTTEAPAYIGLLGPTARRRRIFDAIGPAVTAIAERIRAPVGLSLGARTPAGIALAIVAQIHAVLAEKREIAVAPVTGAAPQTLVGSS